VAPYAKGPNYAADVDRGLVLMRVWRRPDLSDEEGARCAQEMAELLDRLARGPRTLASAVLLDLRDAPPAVGPKTQDLIGRMVQSWEQAGRRFALLVGEDPVQGMQLRLLVKKRAPHVARVFSSLAEARRWTAVSAPGTSSD
jgi:hypothetical protein